LLEVADLVVVNKGDKPGAQRTASQLRAMLVAAAPKSRSGHAQIHDRPRPKRPEVLITTASSGAGVPELLAALDRHRAADREARDAGPRLARAEAQVWAILADRVRETLRDPVRAEETRAVLEAVADHRLDPYTAADRLLDPLVREA